MANPEVRRQFWTERSCGVSVPDYLEQVAEFGKINEPDYLRAVHLIGRAMTPKGAGLPMTVEERLELKTIFERADIGDAEGKINVLEQLAG